MGRLVENEPNVFLHVTSKILTSQFCSIYADEFSREAVSDVPSTDDDEQPIEPISDIGINKINEIMFNSLK